MTKTIKEVIKCVRCTKGFPVNSTKHPNREVVMCPFCGMSHNQPVVNKGWKPNLDWLKGRKLSIPFSVDEMRRQLTKSKSVPVIVKPKEETPPAMCFETNKAKKNGN